MFEKVPSSPRFPDLEMDVLKFWKERDVYGQSLKLREGAPSFVFFEGPPTANGMPHPGHCLTRAIKDLFPRYRTMRGYRCERKAGWDTHGLPVEVEVSKGLGIHTKEEIESYGQEKFIQLCQQSVWKYMQHWEKLTERLGFWIKLDEAYVTYHQSYVESVWWSLKNLFDRGLLYQDHKIVWWWAQGGTALSAGEVGQGYRKVADPSVYIRFPLLDDAGKDSGESLLVWTTTPWTLSSNMFAAVKSDLEYSVVKDPESPDLLVIASALVETVAGKVQRKLEVVRTLSGQELVGRKYRPPFDDYYNKLSQKTGRRSDGSQGPVYWYVCDADFVETTAGSGVVHIAPAFGDVDFGLLKSEREKYADPATGPELLCAVGPDGKFTDAAPAYSGRWVKEADKDISRQLRQEGKVYHHEQYIHDYPFCWRADEDPLIQYPRKSWFIRTTKFKDSMLANNQQINWLPEHIKDGRFGNYLESNVDWSLSRERFWGTPLPIWVCEQTGKMEAIASYAELLAKPGATGMDVWESAKKSNPELVEDLKVHKPYIDAVMYDSPFAPGAKMKRVTEVIDCWYDSGAMPFAQWGWPHQNPDKLQTQFPADFISEALDQTRGWFYSLLSISTLLFSPQAQQEQGQTAALPAGFAPPVAEFPHPFRNCIVLGLMLGEDGTKLSKQKRNYRSPDELFDRYGADALRWYFYSGQAPWSEIRYNEQSIKDSLPEFLLRLWNVYSFFVNYAVAEGFQPGELLKGNVGDLSTSALRAAPGARPLAQRRELDRYILSELHRTVAIVTKEMDSYKNFGAATALVEFVDVLSNWYLRLSRGFFSSGRSESASREATLDAYWTLYECLTTVTKLVAPFTPFFAEVLWKNLVRAPFGERAPESVHLTDFPTADEASIDALLSSQMKLGREIVSLGRAARAEAKLKVRQPLAKVEVILADKVHQEWLRTHREFAADELNVHEVEVATDAEQYIKYIVLPDLKKLGKKLGKLLPLVKNALGKADGGKLMRDLSQSGETKLEVDGQSVALTREDLIVRLEAKKGWAAAQGEQAVVVLSTEITPELAREGLAREIVHTIQSARKDIGCDFGDKIDVALVGGGPDLQAVVGEFAEYIGSETQAVSLVGEPLSGVSPVEIEVGGAKASLYVAVNATGDGRPQA